ncbi:MAG: tRNA 2-thiouridine(34) synthase MnmA [Bacteroidetes bacterium]|nr:tRNA 2-thiouridine(34) synthase MnmA [Bacteroidota bacterium]
MKIAVGLSGGVDSSVAALLLKEQGDHVIGLFMQNWHNTAGTLHGDCEWEEERAIAEMVAKKLGIPFHFVDLSDTYRQRVVEYMFAEYARGRTPNPDVLCNREVKFDAFLRYALDLGVDAVATGHYVRSEQRSDGRFRLLAGVDVNKDQSYFLCQLSQEQLSKAVFPIGHLCKSEVRRLAAKAALPSAEKKDSQGICFVGKVDLPLFLQQQLAVKEGPVVEIFADYYHHPVKCYQVFEEVEAPAELIERAAPFRYRRESGKRVGSHQGAHFYTIGQRKGLGIGGHLQPLFVLDTDVQENIIYVGEGQEHLGLYRKALFIKEQEIHWIAPDLEMRVGDQGAYDVRIRYRQPLQRAVLFRVRQGLFIDFYQPQRGITPGQFAVWYRGEELMGSGAIA